jgi:amino acid transporter
MVSATLPAASATFLLVAPDWADSQLAVTLCAITWLVLVTAVVVKGVGLTAKIQMIMTLCELAILFLISVLVLFRFGAECAHSLNWQLFSPQAFDLKSFASGAVIALFFFWGWDVSLNLNEETQSARQSPGYGALGAVVVIIVFFTAFAAIVLLALSDQEISQSGTNVVFAVADKVLPKPWNYLAVLALMLSTIGTLETSILQFTRTMFSKSRDGLLHMRWATIHQQWGTPYIASFLIATLGSVLLLASLSSKDIAEVMSQSINVIGVQAAYYYGLAGFACVWHFRKQALRSTHQFILMFFWPLISSLALWWAAIWTAMSFNAWTSIIAIGSILLGFWPLMAGIKRIQRAQSSSAAP